MRFISYLAQGYGTDSDVTWLLDNRNVWLRHTPPHRATALFGEAAASGTAKYLA